MDGLSIIAALTPSAPEWRVDWDAISGSDLAFYAGEMAKKTQNPVYHGEGDVWTHTKMVCEVLAGLETFRSLDERGRSILFTAALFHDVGKIRVTRWENGTYISPGHAAAGEKMVREFMWTRLGLCGTPEKLGFRETVCTLIRRHSMPVHVIDDPNAGQTLRAVSELGTNIPDFSLERLCILAEADAGGKICPDIAEQLERTHLCALLAEESGCLSGPYPFPDSHTRFSYLSGRNVPPDYPLFDDCWGPVIMLSGLPGTGKDTWIAQNCKDMPVISLDNIRRALKISPTENQGRVAEEAKRQMQEYLRRREPFVLNATNLTVEARNRNLKFIHSYKAWTRIVYLETELSENLSRNAGRADRVPEDVIYKLIGKITPPTPNEAREVCWLCV